MCTQQQISFDLYAWRSVEQQAQARMQCASYLLLELDGIHAANSIIATFEMHQDCAARLKA